MVLYSFDNDHPAYNLAIVINDKIYPNSNFESLVNDRISYSKVDIPLSILSFLLCPHYKSYTIRKHFTEHQDSLIPIWLPRASPEFMVLEGRILEYIKK